MDIEKEHEARTVHWQGIAGLAFGLWALLVPISAKWVVDSLERMTTVQVAASAEQARRNELLEGRITRIEERQTFVFQTLSRMQEEHSALLERGKPHD